MVYIGSIWVSQLIVAGIADHNIMLCRLVVIGCYGVTTKLVCGSAKLAPSQEVFFQEVV